MLTPSMIRLQMEQKYKFRRSYCYVYIETDDTKDPNDSYLCIHYDRLPTILPDYFLICFNQESLIEWGFISSMALEQKESNTENICIWKHYCTSTLPSVPIHLKEVLITYSVLPREPNIIDFVQIMKRRHQLYQLFYPHYPNLSQIDPHLNSLLNLTSKEEVTEDRIGFILSCSSWKKIGYGLSEYTRKQYCEYIETCEWEILKYRYYTLLHILPSHMTMDEYRIQLQKNIDLALVIDFEELQQKLKDNSLIEWHSYTTEFCKKIGLIIEKKRSIDIQEQKPKKRKRIEIAIETLHEEEEKWFEEQHTYFEKILKCAPECFLLMHENPFKSEEIHRGYVNYLIHLKMDPRYYRYLIKNNLESIHVDNHVNRYAWNQKNMEMKMKTMSEKLLQTGCKKLIQCGTCPYVNEDGNFIIAKIECTKNLKSKLLSLIHI